MEWGTDGYRWYEVELWPMHKIWYGEMKEGKWLGGTYDLFRNTKVIATFKGYKDIEGPDGKVYRLRVYHIGIPENWSYTVLLPSVKWEQIPTKGNWIPCNDTILISPIGEK